MTGEQIYAKTKDEFPTLSASAQARIALFAQRIIDAVPVPKLDDAVKTVEVLKVIHWQRIPTWDEWRDAVVAESMISGAAVTAKKYGVGKTAIYRWRLAVRFALEESEGKYR